MPFHQNNSPQVLITFWKQLSKVIQFTFISKSKSKEYLGWAGKGKGKVIVKENRNVLHYHEKGMWLNKQGEQFTFTNVFRWTLIYEVGVISLEHLRQGINHPVFLFHLSPTNTNSLSSIDPHHCKNDTYFGQIYL